MIKYGDLYIIQISGLIKENVLRLLNALKNIYFNIRSDNLFEVKYVGLGDGGIPGGR